MKSKITILSIILISLFMINVNAKEVQIYFYSEGGKVSTKGFKITDDYVTYKDGTNYATYKDTDTIKKLNSIKGKKFTLKKSGADLVKGKEWYAQNDKNDKYYYFNQSKSYKTSDIIAKLGLTSDPYPVISLFANWNDENNPSGGEVDKPGKAQGISIKASKDSIKVKEKLNLSIAYSPSNSTTETITWSTSNKKVATVSSSGVVTGVAKGTVTITAKSKNGLKATKKISVTKTNYVIVRYKTNGGNLIAPHGNKITQKNSDIYNNGSINVNRYEYDKKLPDSGLSNYNNKDYINIVKSGYAAIKGKEWNTKANGTGKSYSQKKVYKAKDLCNASKKDCTVTLYVNWKKSNASKINIDKTDIKIKLGETTSVKANVDNGSGLSWSVTNPNIAKVDSKGSITGKSVGATTVVVKSKENSALSKTIKVEVETNTSYAEANKVVNNYKDENASNLKKLGVVDLSNYKKNCVKVPSHNGISSAQGFTIAENYYIAAKRNSDDTKATIFQISMNSSKSYKDKPIIVSKITKNNYFGHANALAYNPDTKRIYVTATTNDKYKTINFNDLGKDNVKILEGSIYRILYGTPTLFDPGGLAYDPTTKHFYIGSGARLYVYDSTLSNNLMEIRKADWDITQDIGFYKGNILNIRYNPSGKGGDSNLNNTRNAVDVYNATNGLYKGTYIIKSDAELESLAYNPKTGNFAFYINNIGPNNTDCIQEAKMTIK